jgi:hypothetical protein
MSVEITTTFVKQYNAGIRMLQQQIPSRLRDAVMFEGAVEGDRAFFDQVDATAMSLVTNRHGDTEYTDTPHRRRMVTLATYDVADLIDRADARRFLNNPVNAYSRSMAAASNRQIDDVILAAFDATAATGVDGSGTAAFPDGDFLQDFGGISNLTVESLRVARQQLESQENEEDDADHSWHIVMGSSQREALLSESVVQSLDTNAVRALVNGQINTYLGFNFIKSQRGNLATGDERSVFAWVKASMQLAVSQEGRSFIDELAVKRHSLQVRYELDAGATRMDEKGVVKIIADETTA